MSAPATSRGARPQLRVSGLLTVSVPERAMCASSRRCSTPPAPERLRQTTLHNFRNVVRVVDGVKAARETKANEDTSGRLDAISDDVIAHVITYMLHLQDQTGLPFLRAAHESCRCVASFALTCHRVAAVLRTTAVRQRAEMLARRSTAIRR